VLLDVDTQPKPFSTSPSSLSSREQRTTMQTDNATGQKQKAQAQGKQREQGKNPETSPMK